jgi:hypothetical protein
MLANKGQAWVLHLYKQLGFEMELLVGENHVSILLKRFAIGPSLMCKWFRGLQQW